MRVPKKPTVIELANDFLAGGDTPLEAVVSTFVTLDAEQRRLAFGQLCTRKHQVGIRLIDLLFALTTGQKQQRPVTILLLKDLWDLKRRNDFAETVRKALAEQHAP